MRPRYFNLKNDCAEQLPCVGSQPPTDADVLVPASARRDGRRRLVIGYHGGKIVTRTCLSEFNACLWLPVARPGLRESVIRTQDPGQRTPALPVRCRGRYHCTFRLPSGLLSDSEDSDSAEHSVRLRSLPYRGFALPSVMPVSQRETRTVTVTFGPPRETRKGRCCATAVVKCLVDSDLHSIRRPRLTGNESESDCDQLGSPDSEPRMVG